MNVRATRGALTMALSLLLMLPLGCAKASSEDEGPSNGSGGSAATGGGGMGGVGGGGGSELPPDGFVHLRYSHLFDSGSIDVVGQADAEFYQTVAPYRSGLELPTNRDECGVTLYSGTNPPGMRPGEFDYESAGTLSFVGPVSGWDIEPTTAGSKTSYSLEVPIQILRLGEAYDVFAPGAAFPAFNLPDGLHMPDEVQLTAPPPEGPFSVSGDFPVEWTGGDATEVWISLRVEGSGGQVGQLVCLATADGNFPIPASYIDQLPDGNASFEFRQLDTRPITVPGGRTIELSGIIVLGNTAGTKP